MDCERIEERLSPFLENDVTPEERTEIENHLQICENCRELLVLLKETSASLVEFPELEPTQNLLARLYAIPGRKKRFRLSLDFLLKPSLQPVFAAASVFLIIFSFYFFHPDRQLINQSINRQFHRSYSQMEKLYAQAGAVTDTLGAYKDNLLVSLQRINPWGKNED